MVPMPSSNSKSAFVETRSSHWPKDVPHPPFSLFKFSLRHSGKLSSLPTRLTFGPRYIAPIAISLDTPYPREPFLPPQRRYWGLGREESTLDRTRCCFAFNLHAFQRIRLRDCYVFFSDSGSPPVPATTPAVGSQRSPIDHCQLVYGPFSPLLSLFLLFFNRRSRPLPPSPSGGT